MSKYSQEDCRSPDVRSQAFESASMVNSQLSKAPSNLDPALVSKYDEKRKGKYHLLRQLQIYDTGKTGTLAYLDGKQGRTGKCQIDTFIITAKAAGIVLKGAGMRGLRDKAIPGSEDMINYVPAVKDLHLRINPDGTDDSSRL